MPTIMVVDDDANIRAILKYRFEKENYTVQLANNGRDALSQIDVEQPDAIILDLMMPQVDGLQFLSILRSDPKTEHIPVIVLTALDRRPYLERTRELGAAGFVVKPFSPRLLVEQVEGVLHDGGAWPPEPGSAETRDTVQGSRSSN